MNTQTIYTRAMTLGPFLTLILLAHRRRRGIAGQTLENRTPGPVSHTCRSTEHSWLATPVLLPSSPAGPFLTLILRSGQHWPQMRASACCPAGECDFDQPTVK